MAKSKGDVKKAQQKKDAAEGVVRDPRVAEKAAKANNTMACAICMTEFKVTAKMVEAKQHAESKHPKSTYDTCFPAAGA